MVKQLSASRFIPGVSMNGTVIWIALMLAAGGVVVGGTLNRADAQQLAIDAMFPTTLLPAVSSVPASGAEIVLTVKLENLSGGPVTVPTVYDASGPALDVVTQVVDEFDFPGEPLCPVGVFVGNNSTWTCSYRVTVDGGAPDSSEQHAVLLDVNLPSGQVQRSAGPVDIEYTAGSDVSGNPGPGGTVGWGSQATNDVTVDVTTPTGGPITIGPASGGGPSEYVLMGQTVEITAPSGSQNEPLRLIFRIDATEAANQGVTPTNAVVLRNGDEVLDCLNAGVAVPAQCVNVRDRFPDDDIKLVVLAEQVSKWAVARSARKNDCKDGLWRDLIEGAGGPPFRNQGDCVSFFARHD